MVKDQRREIHWEAHIQLNCIFSPSELDRLRKIKSDPNWIPASERQGFRPLLFPTGKRSLEEYRKMKKEFDKITGG
jgi:hypothetical protein